MSRALRRLVVIIGAGIGPAIGAAPARALTADFPTPCTHPNFDPPAAVSVIKQDTSCDSRSALHTDCLSPYQSEYFPAKWDAVDENGAVVDFTDVALPYVDITLTVQEMNSPPTDVRVGSAGTPTPTP